MTRLFLLVVLLASVYLLALASAKPGDVPIAFLLAGAVLFGLRRFLDPPAGRGRGGTLRRVLGFGPLAFGAAWEVGRGTWQVSLAVLGLGRPLRAGIVAVPIGERTPTGVACSALVATLSPGEVLVDIDWVRREMILHVLDAHDPEAIRERHRRFYRRYQRAVFP